MCSLMSGGLDAGVQPGRAPKPKTKAAAGKTRGSKTQFDKSAFSARAPTAGKRKLPQPPEGSKVADARAYLFARAVAPPRDVEKPKPDDAKERRIPNMDDGT